MGLPNLVAVPQADFGFEEFLFWNAQDHRTIITAIQSARNIILPVYQLEDFDPKDPKGWAERHASAHNDMNAVLGISGANLLDVDLANPEQRVVWVYLQFQEHLQAHTKLGV